MYRNNQSKLKVRGKNKNYERNCNKNVCEEEAGVRSNRRPLSAAIMLDCKKENESSIQCNSLKLSSSLCVSVVIGFSVLHKIHKGKLLVCVWCNDSDALFTLPLQKVKF